MKNIEINEAKPNNPDLIFLIKELDAYLIDKYPDRPVFSIDLEKEDLGNIIFIIGYIDNVPAACGALRLFNDDVCELKRMFVLKEHRGIGLSKKIYYELEKQALLNKKRLIRLETGNKQHEAVNLYKKLGFKRIPNYGDFKEDKISICFEKKIN